MALVDPLPPPPPERPLEASAENRPPPAAPGLLERGRARLRRAAPEDLRKTIRTARAESLAVAIDKLPLSIFELLKFKSFDPFVARATTFSHRTTGRHFLLLAGTPLTDSGGGQRPAQLALELLGRGHRVTYVYRFPSSERGRRASSFAHENLTHVPFHQFSARRFAAERGSRERITVIVELPLPSFRVCARWLRARGAQTVYDCIDEWNSSLGGGWYSRRTEDGLLREADVLVASSRALEDALQARCLRDVMLLPNAVNTSLFDRSRDYQRPADLPRASAIHTYVGALWGEWFDWEWITRLARAQPEAEVVLIGDYRGQCPHPPRNLHFLGLRPQAELPAYLAHSDVCLIPFKVDRLTRAVSPLKVYEYLAMGKPVVASEMPELEGLPGVLTAGSGEQFTEQVARARSLPLEDAEIARFVAANSWRARVRQLERMLGR